MGKVGGIDEEKSRRMLYVLIVEKLPVVFPC